MNLSLPEYSPDKFVDRETELERLQKRVRALIEGRNGHGVIIFTGERGVGKTWLRAHWQEQLRQEQEKVLVIWVDLKKYVGKDAAWTVEDILRQVSKRTEGPDKLLGLDLAEISRNVLKHLREKVLRKQGLILFVDHVYESEWALLPILEDYLLAPLAAEPRVLIVLAGRGRLYPWKTLELGVRADMVELSPFDEKFTKEQLERQVREPRLEASAIHSITEGNPMANYLLAFYGVPEGLDQALEGVLEPVPPEYRQKVREYLEALCVLQDFDEERISTMLAVYYHDPSYRNWTYAQARRVREELIRWAFARWDDQKRAYVLDRITRKLAEQFLCHQKPGIWRALHEEAWNLYTQWSNRYPNTRERWEEEARYHQQQLQTWGDKCPV